MAERITAQKVYEYVREQIVSKALFPGNRIVEDELAEALHTSLTTVRNGIAILSYNGLVDVISNYGTFVTKPTLSDMEQAYAVRTVLEVEAMRLAIPRITEGALLRMEKNLEAQRELTRNYCVTVFISVVLPTLQASTFYWRCSRMAACAAARRAIGTRNGLQDT